MNIENFRDYCLNKKGVTESFPFDETTFVFKVMDKMFALTDIDSDFRINLKCDPERAIELREMYPKIIIAGHHMNKKHWNTIIMDGTISDKFIIELINHSYDLVVSKLSKIKQQELDAL